MPLLVLASLLSCLTTSVSGSLSVDGYELSVTPISGRLSLGRPDGTQLGLSLYELTETDAMGVALSQPGHTITMGDFNALNFSVSAPCQKVVVHSTQVMSRYFYYSANLPNGARITLEVFFVTSNNERMYINNRNELSQIYANNVKLTVTVSGWDWCRSCGGADGQSVYGDNLDLVLALDLPPGGEFRVTTNNTNFPKKVNLGNNMWMSMSRKIKKDAEWKRLDTQFPEITSVSGTNLIRIRMPKFDETILYDPIIALDSRDQEAHGDPDDDSAAMCTASGGKPPVASHGVKVTGSWLAAILMLGLLALK